MRSRIVDWAHALLAATIAVLGIFGTIFLLTKFDSSLWSAQAAGWAQALGTVGAILAAFLVANGQYHRDRAIEQERSNAEERRILAAVKAVFARIGKVTADVVDTRGRSPYGMAAEVQIAALRRLLLLLEKMPPFEIPDEEILLTCHNLQHTISEVCETLEYEYTLLQSGNPHQLPLNLNRSNALLDVLATVIELGTNRCENEIKKRI